MENEHLPQIEMKIEPSAPNKMQAVGIEKTYMGKVAVHIMSREELMEERERESKKESYLNLPFKCVSCIKGFELESMLRNHNRMIHSTIKYKIVCDICQSVLRSEKSHKKHTMRHLKRYVCVACGKRATEIHSLTQHYNQEHGDLPNPQFECDQCDFVTESYRTYRCHKEKHKRPQCNICMNTFATDQSLKVHTNSAHRGISRQYECAECGKEYKTRSGIVKHIEANHGSGQGAYCAACHTHFATKATLAYHLKTHSAHLVEDNRRHACQICDAKYSTKASLQAHVNWKHGNNCKNKCIPCSKAFKTSYILKKPQEYVHEKKRRPKNKICDYCGTAFESATKLITHIYTQHIGERPLQCTHCSATFGQPASLHNHKKLPYEINEIK